MMQSNRWTAVVLTLIAAWVLTACGKTWAITAP